MSFQASEESDGVRCTWNYLPKDQASLEELIIPVSVVYTPYKFNENIMRLEYAPQKCKTCEAYLNPHCLITANKLWNCVFCQNKNQLPTGFVNQLQAGQPLVEIQQGMSTVEYSFSDLGKTDKKEREGIDPSDSLFIFLVDTSVAVKELKSIKESIISAIQGLPDNVSIGLVTFSRYVSVYELSNQIFIRSVIMDGKEKLKFEDTQKMLGIKPQGKEDIRKYLARVGELRENIVEAVRSISADPWVVLAQGRPERALHSALQACLALTAGAKSNGGRVVACIGGPATVGEGIIAPMSKQEFMRAHFDLEEGNPKAKMYEEALTCYKALAEKFRQHLLTLDVFGFCPDQFGLAELKPMVAGTGGMAFVHEEFADQLFRDNLANYFSLNEYGELKVASGASISLFVSAPLLIKGAIGPVVSLKKPNKQASKDIIGEGETNQWYIGGLDQSLSVTFFLDATAGKDTKNTHQNAYIQFATRYKHPSGPTFLRVTTIVRNYLEKSNHIQYLGGLDQETVIAVYAKLAARKSLESDTVPVIRWLDRILILLMKKFSNYRKNDKNSFQVAEELHLLPQFFYYLRKSNYVRKFASSVDEATYYRLCMDRETVANSLVMVQPSLMQYDLENEDPQAAVCSIESMKDDVILLMDSYFHTVIWQGTSIVEWVGLGYHEQEEYANLKKILETPDEDLKLVSQDRMYIPKIVHCIAGSGDERIIKSKLNPSSQIGNTTVEGGSFISDDKSLTVFMDHLMAATVASD